MTEKSRSARGLWLIAAFKLAKGLALIVLGVGALKLVHKDVAAEAERWIGFLRIDPYSPIVQKLLAKFWTIDDHKLRALGIGTFFYASLFLTEGTGLALKKRWAEYLTIISTASLLPLEMYEIVKRFNFVRIALLLINIAVVVYLVIEVRRSPRV